MADLVILHCDRGTVQQGQWVCEPFHFKSHETMKSRLSVEIILLQMMQQRHLRETKSVSGCTVEGERERNAKEEMSELEQQERAAHEERSGPSAQKHKHKHTYVFA